MIGAQNLPTISQLYDLIEAVPRFPISARQLAAFARRKGADKKVVNFYKYFPTQTLFNSPEDLAARSEMVEMMNLDAELTETSLGIKI